MITPAVLVLLPLLGLAAARPAPTAEEQRLFAEGVSALAAGDAMAAAHAFRDGYGVARDPAFLPRMAEAQEKAGAPAEALETYRRYLREAPDASDRADIEQRIARLAPPPPARVGGDTPAEFGAAVNPTLPSPQSPPARRAVIGDPEPARPTATDGGSGWNRYNVTAMSAAGATVLLLGTAAFFGAQASSKESDVNRLQSFHDEKTLAPVPYSTVAQQYESALADGRRDAHDARLALLAAAGAGVVAAVFFVIDAHHAAESAVAFAPAPVSTSGGTGAALTASWRF